MVSFSWFLSSLCFNAGSSALANGDAAWNSATVGKLLVDADAWRAYWRCAFWFCIVSLAFRFESDVGEVVTADSGRNAAERVLPSDFDDKLKAAIKSLGEVPPQSLWVYISLRGALSMDYLVTLFIHTPCMLWITFIWRQMNPSKVFKIAPSMRVSPTRTLSLERK